MLRIFFVCKLSFWKIVFLHIVRYHFFCKPFVYFDIFCSHFVCPDHFVFIIFFKSQIILQIVILYHFFANCCSRSNYSANCRSRSLFANCFSGSNCFASFRFSSLLANCSTECKEDQSETVLRFPIELFRNLCSVLLFGYISWSAMMPVPLPPLPPSRAPPGLSLSRSLSLSWLLASVRGKTEEMMDIWGKMGSVQCGLKVF